MKMIQKKIFRLKSYGAVTNKDLPTAVICVLGSKIMTYGSDFMVHTLRSEAVNPLAPTLASGIDPYNDPQSLNASVFPLKEGTNNYEFLGIMSFFFKK